MRNFISGYWEDNRTLHVKTDFEEYENFDVAAALSDAQAKLVYKFKQVAKGKSHVGAGSAAEAKKISNFLQKIKYIDRHGGDDIEDQAFLEIIKRAKILSSGSARGKLLPKSLTSGAEFEKVLGAIVTSTIEYASGQDLSNVWTKTLFGTKSFRAGNLQAFENEIINISSNIVTARAQRVRKELSDQIKNKHEDFVNIKVSPIEQSNAKIDVSGRPFAEVELTIDSKSEIYEIASLLQRASFSAKNYDLTYYRHKIQQRVTFQSERNMQLLLGNTKLDTVFFSLFGGEYPAPVVLSFLFYSLNTRDESVRMKLAQLRFIYELTGYGQRYVNQEIEQLFHQDFDQSPFRVNYFIWNNPSTDTIVVKSTAELIDWSYNTYYENLTSTIRLPAKILLR